MDEIRTDALILAGGSGSRMGADKARLRYEGKSLAWHVLMSLIPCSRRVALSRNVNQGRVADVRIPVIRDEAEGFGPLAGVLAGLRWSQSDRLLVVAVDLPQVSSIHLQRLQHKAEETDADAVISIADDRVQPLCGLYHIRIREKLTGWLEERELRVQTFTARLGLVQRIEATKEELFNVNVPSDLDSLAVSPAGSW